MRFHRTAVFALSLVLLCTLLQLGCGPSQAFVRANEAEQSGDWIAAVQGYRQALAEDPEEEEIAARLAYAEDQLAITTVFAVDEAVSLADYGRALTIIGTPRVLMPQDPRLLESERHIRTSGITCLGERLTFGEFRFAYEQTGLLATYFAHDPDVVNLHTEARLGYYRHLTERALASEEAGRTGAALVAWIAAVNLMPEETLAQHATNVRLNLVEEIKFRFTVNHSGLLSGAPPPVIAGAAAEAVDDPDQAMLVVTTELGETTVEETYRAYIAHQRYVAGYHDVPNPSYQSAFDRTVYAEQRLIDAEGDVIDDEANYFRAEEERAERIGASDYDSYHSRWESAFDRLQDSRRDVQRRREELLNARRDLARIPPTVTEEIWDDFPYEVREFTLRSSAEFWCALKRPDQAEHQLHEVFWASTSDTTHDGYPHVGVASNPLNFPLNDTDLAAAIRTQALRRTAEIIADDFTNYRAAFLAEGLAVRETNPDLAIEHLVRYVLLNPGNVSDDVVAFLDIEAELWDLSLLH